MKKIYLFLFLIQLSLLSAQGFNYQSTVRNSNNSIAANTVVKFKFYIRQNSDSGTIIYTETHQTQTNNLGVVNLVIGQGTATVGNFSQINWTSATYYLGIEYNINSTCQWIPVSTGANGQVMSKCNGVYTWGSCPEYTNLVWSDEFNTNGAPDSTKWSYDIGNWGWGNGEAQNYTNRTNNAVVLDGNLKIIAKKESYGGSEYTSARLKTLNKLDFTYGRVEVRAKLPYGAGTWPAIWMLGSNIETTSPWPACGEVDIMEHIGNNQDVIFGTLHYPGHSGGGGDSSSTRILNASIDFHIYKIIWSSSYIKFYVDDNLFKTFTNTASIPFNSNFFLLLNVAMGGSFGGAIDSSFTESTMYVDYVRVYQ